MRQVPNNPAIRPGLDELIALRREAQGKGFGPRRPARGLLAGAHHSRFRGRGMDYLESRVYQPGDDIRNLDWRVSARSGRVHTKVYHEERERPVVLLADFGAGMFFATRGRFKSVIAARAAAWFGWSAVAHGDRVGALLSNGRHWELRPRAGDKGVLRLIRALVTATDPERGLNATHRPGALNAALHRLHRVARPGSLVVVLSDFQDLDEQTGLLLGQLRLHSDLLAVRVLDALEQAPPPPSVYPVTDGTRRGWLDLRDHDRRAAYQALFAQRRRQLERLLKRQAIPLLELSTTDDVASVLGTRMAWLARGRQ